MTQWTKEDLYGRNTMPTPEGKCVNCKFCFMYSMKYTSGNVTFQDCYCTNKATGVKPTDSCRQYVRR